MALSPRVARAREKHVFNIYGCCAKGLGDPKVRAYETIVKELNESGFNLAFDFRYDDSTARARAKKVADQLKSLLANDMPPEDITAAGYSLSPKITALASGFIANPKVKSF